MLSLQQGFSTKSITDPAVQLNKQALPHGCRQKVWLGGVTPYKYFGRSLYFPHCTKDHGAYTTEIMRTTCPTPRMPCRAGF